MQRSFITAMIPAGVIGLVIHLSAMAVPLPIHEPEQKVLRDYLASLTVEDVALRVAPPTEMPEVELDLDQRYYLWMAQEGFRYLPLGTIKQAPADFMLDSIEGGDKIMTPLYRNAPAAVAYMTQWRSPMNPYYNSAVMQRRAMVGVIIDLIMLEDLHQQGESQRSDLTGETMLRIAYVYHTCKQVVPASVRQAFEVGMKRIQERIAKWGPTGINGNMDFFALAGNWYVWQATQDPRMKRIATDYADTLLKSGRFFKPAGYAVDAGIADMSYEGITRFFLTWGAMVTDWPVTREALDKSYRLKNFTSLQDPDGHRIGPSHMNSRTPGHSAMDQWRSRFRDAAAATITDRALPWIFWADQSQLDQAPQRFLDRVRQVMNEPPYQPQPWWRKAFVGEVNYLYLYGPDDWYQTLTQRHAREPELFELPVMRRADYIEWFEDFLVSAKLGGFAAMVHVGNTSYYQGGSDVKSPWGFGGGQVSAFWTRKSGTVILGLRRYAYAKAPDHDSYDEWRQWASHAVSGMTEQGRIVSSVRIRNPKVKHEIDSSKRARITFSAELPDQCGQQGELMQGPIDYARAFDISDKGVKVVTQLGNASHQPFVELYEIIPVFLYDAKDQVPTTATRIAWRVGDGPWTPATSDWAEKVTAIRLERFTGAVDILFDQSQRVRLTQEPWQQHAGWKGDGRVRNLLIDLKRPSDSGNRFVARQTAYTIAPVEGE